MPFDAPNFRNLVKEVSGKDITTEHAKSFLELFESDLIEAIQSARREFVKKHFGTRNTLTDRGPR